VNILAPGWIDTDMTRGFSAQDAAAYAAEETALGRIGTAAEVAEAAAFLLSDAAAYVTGQVVEVAG
jgi:3-oxoacyl-[acyl-carrier protein] reductase